MKTGVKHDTTEQPGLDCCCVGEICVVRSYVVLFLLLFHVCLLLLLLLAISVCDCSLQFSLIQIFTFFSIYIRHKVAFSTNKNSGFITTLFYQISLCSDISNERMILHGYELYYDGYLRGKITKMFVVCNNLKTHSIYIIKSSYLINEWIVISWSHTIHRYTDVICISTGIIFFTSLTGDSVKI